MATILQFKSFFFFFFFTKESFYFQPRFFKGPETYDAEMPGIVYP